MIEFIFLDADYTYNRMNEPVVRLYGIITSENHEKKDEDIIVHVIGFEPYIYIGDCGLDIFILQKMIENVTKGYLKRIDIVKKFKPIGYQIEKSNMLKLVLYNPKVVPELRELLKDRINEITDSQLYEADIPYATTRFPTDKDINGMDIVQFDERGKELSNYGLGCNNLYICGVDDISAVKSKLVDIDY